MGEPTARFGGATESLCAACGEPAGATSCGACGADPSLRGEYLLQQVVGHGAHGTTYRAVSADGQVVAIKELLVRKVQSLKAISLFEREARVLKQLRHPGVPHYIEELHVEGGRSVSLYLVQEFIEGQTLAQEFASRRATVEEVFLIAAELLDTLAYLHSVRPSVIHRDIKPANVMRSTGDAGDAGRLVLIDFGAVRDAVDTAEGGSTVAGTFGYMAPEQFMGRALPQTDIYGVGATIVALLSRKEPQQLMEDGRTIAWEGELDLPPRYASLLRSMLVADADARAGDAAQLARQIRAAVVNPALDVELGGVPKPQPYVQPDLPVPAAPRAVPHGFGKKYAVDNRFDIIFGGIFLTIGLIATIAPLMGAIASGSWKPLLLAATLGIVFGGFGVATAPKAHKMLGLRKEAYRHGVAHEALLIDVGRSTYEMNNRHANVYTYQYMVDGEIYTGRFDSWNALMLSLGDPLTVLVSPDRPDVSVVYNPDQYHPSYAAIATLRRGGEVEVELEAEVDVKAEADAKAEVGSNW